jgi:hypothetical protein
MWADKVHEVLCSPITALVFTIILAALAASGRLGMSLSNFLLVITFIIGSFGIYRVGYGLHLTIIYCLVLAITLATLSWWLEPENSATNVATPPPITNQKQPSAEEIASEIVKKLPETKNNQIKQSKGNRFSIVLSHIILERPLFIYKTTNNNIYFIDVLLRADIVNNDNVFAKINDYSCQMLINNEWITLRRPEFTNQGQFYAIENISTKRASIIKFDKKTIDEQIKDKNIEPGKTITGLMMFYITKDDLKKYTIDNNTKLKINLYDSLKNKEEHIFNMFNKNVVDQGVGHLNALAFTIIRKGINLNKYKIMNDPLK